MSKFQCSPTVSIITASYNQGHFIEETIVSVLSQEGDFFLDYLIMDGGSTDNSIEIVRRYDRLVREGRWQTGCRGISFRWTSERDSGQADAINKGLALARGTIVGWLNSDDTYLPGAIAKVVAYMREHPDSVMVYGSAHYTDKDGIVTGSYPTEPFRLERLAEKCFICQPAAFVRAEALAAAGRLDAGLLASMDYDLWIRMGKKFEDRIAYLDQYLATSRMYPENKTNAIRDMVLRENLRILQRYFGYINGEYIASCFYDIYENRRHLSVSGMLREISRRLFVVRYLFNLKTLLSSLHYVSVTLKKVRTARS